MARRLLAMLTLVLAVPAARADEARKPAVSFDQVAPLVAKYCVGCHGGEKPRAGVALDKYKDEAMVKEGRQVWAKVLKRLQARDMPPVRKPQPTPAERDLLTSWIDTTLGAIDCGLQRDPGRVTVRRLNRAEYNNTIRDLVGVKFQPAEDFPADDVGYGFDNIGDVLTLPPLLMEKYLAAAEKIVEAGFQDPALRARILVAQPDDKTPKADAARRILTAFARRAYRRPVRDEETTRLLTLVDLAEKNGDGFDKGIQLALQAVLVSPHFLFRIERDPRPDKDGGRRQLDDFELATRVSYFLWSSMPDDELFRLAEQQALRKDGNLEKQIRRMLRDTKARALTDNFAGQWLQLRNLKNAAPDPGTYPAFDEPLRTAMIKEAELFFEAVVREDRSVLDFLDGRFTFVNERLAKHYGIPGVRGDGFRRIELTDGRRGGVLTMASVLTLTSNPTRTSPVKRGKWILENILGTPPPPPPPDVPELSEDKAVIQSGSLRQRLELHRAKPDCAVCHSKMDPLGLAFENYDGIGGWRDKDGKFAIDPSGELPGGQVFKGPEELKKVLKGRQDDFCRCLSEKMLTYALGRGLEYYDKCAVDDLAQSAAKDGYRLSALVLAVVHSEPFQYRRGRK